MCEACIVLYTFTGALVMLLNPAATLLTFLLLRRAGEFSTLMASFYLQRNMGNFLIQVYGPCMLLVVLSWVSFWLNREATSDRISLGKNPMAWPFIFGHLAGNLADYHECNLLPIFAK